MPFLGRPTIILYCVVGLDESTPFEEDIKADNSLLVAYAPRSLFFFARGGEGSPNSHFTRFFPLFLISFQVVFLLGLKEEMKSPLVGRVPVHPNLHLAFSFFSPDQPRLVLNSSFK